MFENQVSQTKNEKLINVRETFDQFNLISALHTFYYREDKIYKNILPPLRILNKEEEKDLFDSLDNLNFTIKSQLVA